MNLRFFVLLVALLAACTAADSRCPCTQDCATAYVAEPSISLKIAHAGTTWGSSAVLMDSGPNSNIPDWVNGLSVTGGGATITLVCSNGNTVWLQATSANGKFYVNGTMSSPTGTCLASTCSPVAVASGFYSYAGQGGSGVVPYCGPVLTIKERESRWGKERDAFQARFQLLSADEKDEIKQHLIDSLSHKAVSHLYTDKLAFLLGIETLGLNENTPNGSSEIKTAQVNNLFALRSNFTSRSFDLIAGAYFCFDGEQNCSN